jgi:hypothetical protein
VGWFAVDQHGDVLVCHLYNLVEAFFNRPLGYEIILSSWQVENSIFSQIVCHLVALLPLFNCGTEQFLEVRALQEEKVVGKVFAIEHTFKDLKKLEREVFLKFVLF